MPGATFGDEPVRHVGKRRVRISGRFFPNGSGAIDNTLNQGKKGWTVARTAQGVYTLTLERRWMKLVPLGLGLQLNSAAARIAQWGAFTPTVDGTGWQCVIRVVDGSGAAQDVAADANNSIGFELEAVQDTVQG